MITRVQRRRYIFNRLLVLALLLCLAIGVFAFVFYAQYRAQLEGVKAQTVNPDPDASTLIDAKSLDITVQERLEDSLNRPLLMTNRRPYVPPPPVKPKPKPKEAPPPEPPKEAIPINEKLVSVIVLGQRKIAFLQGAEGTTRLEEGMTFKDWQVSGITADSLTLTFHEQQKVLQLRTFATAQGIAPMRQLGTPDKKQ